ncbi:MAG: TOBE domain-containing protein, partial [Rhodospirillaceae bacterium]|nr:TOBE domain-containing protein [Rhodospirillaceae bacterium]
SDICELLGLNDLLARRPYNLSGGERQRVAIGRALLSYPKLLLMDEPLASLDLQRKSEIMPFIERLSDQFGIAVIYVSHSVEEVVRLSDTIALISDGKAIAQGSLSDVMNRIDLSPYTGRHEAGAVLNATVLETNAANGLSTLSVSGHTLWVPQIDLQANAPLRIRIRARDVALALSAPIDTSILNMLPATVREIAAHDGPHCELALEITPTAPHALTTETPEILIARITRRSLEQMNLKVGTALYAMMKAVAIDRRSLGGLGHGPRS